jgi:hypothetical protein
MTPRARLAVLAGLAVLVVAVAAWAGSGDGGDGGGLGGPSTSPVSFEAARGYVDAAEERLGQQGLHLQEVCDRSDPTEAHLLALYGAVFVASDEVRVPPACVFADASAVGAFQAEVPSSTERIGGFEVRLQTPALDALLAARDELREQGRDLAPRGADAAWRDAAAVESLWRDRVDAGLEHWRRARRITTADADRIRALPPRQQVGEVLALEERGLAFGTRQAGPILQSVAAPGSSQHLAMLAFDVREYTDPVVIAALARHGWFRTVVGDEPHVTYLGRTEAELPRWGLHAVRQAGVAYWVPDLVVGR